LAKRLTDEELAALINAQESQAVSYSESHLATERARALDYYLGKPFGNEVDGRSQVVSTDVFEAVEGMLPALLEIFLSSNKLVECEAYGPEDEAEAKQQTEVANHIILKQNNAFLIFNTWFKDALIQKTGIVKTYYDPEYKETRIAQYKGLTDGEMVRILDGQDVEVLEREVREETFNGPSGPVSFPVSDIKVRVTTKREKVVIKNVAPENFFVSTRQTSLDLTDCEFVSHKERKTHTDLLEMGVKASFLDGIGDEGNERDFTEEAIARDIYNTIANRDTHNTDASLREYWVSDGVMLVDEDGDGIAELVHFIKIGNKVWLREETDVIPFSVICPIPLPHQFFGKSVADITADVQMTKSVLWRQMLDNLYLTNNPQKAVLEGQVNLDDLLTSRPGGIIRERVPNATRPLETPFVAKESFPMLEYWDTVKETRTGVTRYNQGLDADSLNKTAHGIQSILGQSMKRLEMVARIIAETGVKDMVRKVLHCVSASGMKRLPIKLTNGYVDIDPREWKHQYNVTVNVGLGTGTKDRQLQMLAMLSQKQLELMQVGKGYMVSDQNIYNLDVKLAEAAGFKNPEMFFTDPRMVPPEAKQAPPPPEVIKLQQDKELKLLDMQVTSQQKDKDMANTRYIESLKAKTDQETKIAVAQLSKAAQETTASIAADTQKRAKMADAMLADHQMRGDAEMKVFETAADQEAKEAEMKSKMMDEYMPQLIQAIQQGTEQNVQGFQMMAQELQKLQQMMLAPRKAIKDKKTGKTIGVEIAGAGTVQVQ
jgi:hypothetical protein